VAVAVRVTDVPSLKGALHVAPQLMPEGAEVTVPWPAPAFVTVSVCVTSSKVAVTVVALLMVTLQGSVPTQPATPDHPVNVDPGDAVAVRSTLEPTLKLALQVAPQLIPAGVEATEPVPVPARATVRAACATLKLAVAVVAPFSVNVQAAPELPPAHETPVQPAKVEPGDVAAVSVTLEPTLKLVLHVAPQLMPAGLDVTVPLPAPDLRTVSCAVGIENVAVTVAAAATVKVHVVPLLP